MLLDTAHRLTVGTQTYVEVMGERVTGMVMIHACCYMWEQTVKGELAEQKKKNIHTYIKCTHVPGVGTHAGLSTYLIRNESFEGLYKKGGRGEEKTKRYHSS